MNRHIGQIENGELHQVFREKRFVPRRRTRKDRIDGRREKKGWCRDLEDCNQNKRLSPYTKLHSTIVYIHTLTYFSFSYCKAGKKRRQFKQTRLHPNPNKERLHRIVKNKTILACNKFARTQNPQNSPIFLHQKNEEYDDSIHIMTIKRLFFLARLYRYFSPFISVSSSSL